MDHPKRKPNGGLTLVSQERKKHSTLTPTPATTHQNPKLQQAHSLPRAVLVDLPVRRKTPDHLEP